MRIRDLPVSPTETPTLPISKTIPTVSPQSLDQTDDKGKGPSLIEPDIAKGCVVATKGSYVEVFQTLVKNIAPISDAVLADLDESGQVRVFAFPLTAL